MRSRATWLLLAAAALILAAYALSELLGLRETTSLLTRIDALSDPAPRSVVGLLLFLASYALAILVAPVLLIAAVLGELIARVRPGHARPQPTAPHGDAPDRDTAQA
jgi:hypothetical protein